MISDERRIAFLKDLEALTRKHNIAIGGCGCCGSPYLWEPANLSEKSGYVDNDPREVCWREKREE